MINFNDMLHARACDAVRWARDSDFAAYSVVVLNQGLGFWD